MSDHTEAESTATSEVASGDSEEVNRTRLFWGVCLALIPTAATFAIIGDILGSLKSDFILSNYEVGLIGGAGLWGNAFSMVLFGPLADYGMRRLARFAFVSHLVGVTTMIAATGLEASPDIAFWVLFMGAWITALGNGFTEVYGNPLVTALYPQEKTKRLNQFHAWYPGGIVIAGIVTFLVGLTAIGSWEVRVALIYPPVLIYGAMILNQPFPPTENVSAGVSIKEMFKATFTSPFFLLLLACAAVTASLELAPMRWIPEVLKTGGIPGLLVLAWTSGLMALMRFYAGPFIDKFSPPGLLTVSAVLCGAGLYLFSIAESTIFAFAVAPVFAVGVSFFWPTMMGYSNEQVPRSGALGLGLIGGVGMLAAGLVMIPLMGDIADSQVDEQLPAQETVQLLEKVNQTFPAALDRVQEDRKPDIEKAITLARDVTGTYEKTGELPATGTANALRAITSSGVESPVVGEAQALLRPAENYGGRISFRYVAPLAGVLAIVFAVLYWRTRREGGYRTESIDGDGEAGAPSS